MPRRVGVRSHRLIPIILLLAGIPMLLPLVMVVLLLLPRLVVLLLLLLDGFLDGGRLFSPREISGSPRLLHSCRDHVHDVVDTCRPFGLEIDM